MPDRYGKRLEMDTTFLRIELSALSLPTKGSYIWLGDWPWKVKTAREIRPGLYKVTLMRG
jgi:hypothetical protein